MNNDTGYKRIPVRQSAEREVLSDTDDRTHWHMNHTLLTGMLTGKITVLTPLHVGTGQLMRVRDLRPAPSVVPSDVDLTAAFFREGEQLIIPGSSLKGAFRHLYEIVTPSCMAQSHRMQSPPNDLRPCYYRADTRMGARDIEICPACRVFGAQGYMGQVYFHTAHAVADTRTRILFAPQRWEPKVSSSERTRKLYTHDISSAELVEPLEVLPVDTILSLRMDFRNLTPDELGILLLVMGQGQPTIYPKLGGAKAHGFGGVELEIQRLDLVTPQDYLSYDAMTVDSVDLSGYLSAVTASDLFVQTAWADVVAVLGAKPEAF